MTVVHEAVEDRGAHRVVTEIGAAIVHDAVGGDDGPAPQLVALMDQGFQQRAGIVGDQAPQ